MLFLVLASACDPPLDPGEGARLELRPGDMELFVGDTAWLIATVFGRDGEAVAEPSVQFRPSEFFIAHPQPHSFFHSHPVGEHEAGARVYASGLGEVVMTALRGDLADSVRITVRGHSMRLDTVVAHGSTICGLTAGGDAYCWGYVYHHLGHPGTIYPEPTLAPAPVGGGIAFRQVTNGWSHTCAIALEGRAYCWGQNQGGVVFGSGNPYHSLDPVPIAGDLRFTHLTAGEVHRCGVTDTGALYCWGLDRYGQVGIAETAMDRCTVQQVPCTAVPIRVAPDMRFRTVEAGEFHTCAIGEDDQTYCWGFNRNQQLGHESPDSCDDVLYGSVPCTLAPRPVVDAPQLASLSAGSSHTCGLTSDGRTFCWGHNGFGELGTGDFTDSMIPVPLSGDLRFRQLDGNCGLTFEGEAWCWGSNRSYRNGTEEYEVCPGHGGGAPCNPHPVRVWGGHAFHSISRGGWTGCGVADDGVYCWGRNDGRFGTGSGEPRTSATPLRVYDGN